MKLMTMNVHSLVEKDYERKLVEFADVAAREKPDILALQEVSQLMSEAVWPDEELEGFVRCREVSMPVRRGNYAAKLAGLLKERGFGCSWTWIGAKVGYGFYDEGLALFSRTPIAETDQFFISRSQDYQNWKTRKVLGIRTEAMKHTWFYTVHMGWWDDREESFLNQWTLLNETLEKTGKKKHTVWLMGILTALQRFAVRDMTWCAAADGRTAMPGQQKRTKESRLVWRLTGGGKESLATLKKRKQGCAWIICSAAALFKWRKVG